jgi:hypothetical protein
MTNERAVETLQTDAVAKELMQSSIPARLAYIWHDGTPRVVPMWFHWTGQDFLMGAPPNAPKMKVLQDRPRVSFTIDDATWPYKVLCVHGTASVEFLDNAFSEYGAMARRYLGEEGAEGFMAARDQTFGKMGWARITIRPEEVRILDFAAGKFPSAWASAEGNS